MRRSLLNAFQVLAILALVAALAVGLLLLLAPSWFWHPLATQVCAATYHTAAQVRDCKSYNAWSGSFGSWLTNLPQWIIVVGLLWWHHNCHEPGCWRPVKTGKTRCEQHGK